MNKAFFHGRSNLLVKQRAVKTQFDLFIFILKENRIKCISPSVMLSWSWHILKAVMQIIPLWVDR